MKKEDLVAKVAEKLETSKESVRRIIDSSIEVMKETLTQNKEEINISGFIKITPIDKPARPGRNPKTGETIMIGAKTSYKAKMSDNL